MEEKPRGPKLTNLIGRRFEKLLVIEYDKPKWKCRCDCGVEKSIWPDLLKKGKAKSCGCLRGKGEKTNGRKNERVRRIRSCMMGRCYNTKDRNYHLYGGRGIAVCERWRNSFKNFLDDMGEPPSTSHTLDRKDNNGDYSPSNCRWASIEEQSNNRSSNVFLEFKGERLSISQWARKLGISKSVLRSRINKNLPIEKILSEVKTKSSSEIAREKHEFEGENLTMLEWADRLKVNYLTFKSYALEHGIEKAILFYKNGRKVERNNRCCLCGRMISKGILEKRCKNCS